MAIVAIWQLPIGPSDKAPAQEIEENPGQKRPNRDVKLSNFGRKP